MSDLVVRSSFRKLTPIVVPRSLPVLPGRVWSPEEWTRIRLGFRARSMEDRWHIFAEGDRLFLHRSWLGDGKYEVMFRRVDGGRRIAEIVVESQGGYPPGPDEYASVLLELLICSILLNEPVDDLRERLSLLRRTHRDTPRA